MRKANAMVLVTCKNGHEISFFPEKCIFISGEDTIRFSWECYRCVGIPNHNTVVADIKERTARQ
jgi:hypothetical protein